MVQILGTNQAGLTGTGTFTLPLPTASGIQSVFALIGHEGPLTAAANWTVLFDVDINGTYHYNTMSGNFGIAFCVANISNSPGTTWGFTQLYPNFVCAGIIVGYDGAFLDSNTVESTLGNATSPGITVPADWQVIRTFFDAGESTSVTYPTNATYFGSYQFRQVASGAAALVALTHEESPGGSMPAYDEAEWTLPSAPEGSTGFTLAIQFDAPPGPQPTTPTITTTSLNTMRRGTAFNQTLAATGTTPITWTLQSGTLPAGLTLNASTGQISGTPTALWTYNFTIRATNTAGYDDQSYSGNILFPGETGRDLGTTDNNTSYARVRVTISGDNAIFYAPVSKVAGDSSVFMMVAHGAEDDETFIDNHPFETVEHCLDKGWVMLCPYADGNQFANSTAETIYSNAITYVNTLWPVADFIWYGFSMGANAPVVFFVRNGGSLNGYPFKGLVLIDTPWDMLWHWNNGSGWEHGLIMDAYGGYDAAYDAATYDPSDYDGMKAFVSYSPDDTVAVATHDSLAMQSYTAGHATLTMYQSYGEHENPPHFAPTQVNAWLDNLMSGSTPNTFDRLYVGTTLAARAYLGTTLVWEE